MEKSVLDWPVIAICYDFDGTLAPGNMQEYGFIPKLDATNKKFWDESKKFAQENHADQILAYMMKMLTEAAASNLRTTRTAFHEYGRDVRFFPGVIDWFARMNQYGAEREIAIEHYIVSSGLTEIIEGTSIAHEFKKIYACSFCYDHNDVAKWPAQAVNFTTKTQYLFRINKDADNDDLKVNRYIPEMKRRIPFGRFIYIGDGETDVPCMKLVKNLGGFSIAVHDPDKNGGVCERLFHDGRINFYAPADYSEGTILDEMVKQVIDRVTATCRIEELTIRNCKDLPS